MRVRRRDTRMPMGPFWDYQRQDDPVVLFDVDKTSIEYQQIEMLFLGETAATDKSAAAAAELPRLISRQTHELLRVQRVQNIHLYAAYQAQKDTFQIEVSICAFLWTAPMHVPPGT